MKRTATARWKGKLKEGQGIITTESAAILNMPYNFAKRFQNESGTNPEELIGAAHAGCFAMYMSGEIEKMGFVANSIDVQAEVTLDNASGAWGISEIHLDVLANVPGATEEQIQEAANSSKTNCPISKLLKANITMTAHLAMERPNREMSM